MWGWGVRNLFKGPDENESDLTKEGRTKGEHCQGTLETVLKGLSDGLKEGQGIKDEC